MFLYWFVYRIAQWNRFGPTPRMDATGWRILSIACLMLLTFVGLSFLIGKVAALLVIFGFWGFVTYSAVKLANRGVIIEGGLADQYLTAFAWAGLAFPGLLFFAGIAFVIQSVT